MTSLAKWALEPPLTALFSFAARFGFKPYQGLNPKGEKLTRLTLPRQRLAEAALSTLPAHAYRHKVFVVSTTVEIPPTIQLLLDAKLDPTSSKGLDKQLGGLLHEMSRQAEWAETNFPYCDMPRGRAPTGFVAVASGAMNPMIGHGLCLEGLCRQHAARQMAQTLGVYADTVLIPDGPARFSLTVPKRATPMHLAWLITFILVVRELEPLIRAGVIQFWSGGVNFCERHSRQFNEQVAVAVAERQRTFTSQPKIQRHGNRLAIDTGELYDPPIVAYRQLTEREQAQLKRRKITLKEIAREVIASEATKTVRASLIDLRFSQATTSTLFSTSRSDLLALKAFDTAAPALNEVVAWEQARSFQLPWVSGMTSAQVLQLREEASDALPAFRETFVRRIASPNAKNEEIGEALNELRAGAAELEGELKAVNPGGETIFRNIAGGLGLAVAIYGAAMGMGGAAATGLLPLLGLLHNSAKKEREELTTLRSKPAYVLLRAKELTQHAPGKA